MLNYANLNDLEFEALCRDVMEQLLGVSLRRFASGRDGGVDLTNDAEKRNVIVQVKHYVKTDTAALIRSLKAEFPKVHAQAPAEYYICCSWELSCDQIADLYRHFQPYMKSPRNIITILEIDDFLKQEENIHILRKHFKLWIDATGILEDLCNDSIFVDCEVFLADIADLHKRFVPTAAFDEAWNCLQENKVLCILGDPGVGKSITSKMLALTYAAQGWRVRYTTDVTDLSALKASLRRDPNTREIIVLDDCFGQAYFEMNSTQSTELLSLIQYVKLHPTKRLLLNSRITIYQEAGQRRQDLIRALEQGAFQVYLLDLNNLSRMEKARIFYNHLAFSNIPTEHWQNLCQDQQYRRIIFHRNFNPRIIEFVCAPVRSCQIPSSDFFAYIIMQLDNPQEVWKEEYEYRLQTTDRILLQTVYSLTSTAVSMDLVRTCFDRRIASNPLIDKTVDQFRASLLRLGNSFLTILDRNGYLSLAMCNPSVNDYLDGRLAASPSEKEELIGSICTTEQMRRLLPEEAFLPYAVDLLTSGRIETFLFPTELYKHIFIACCILSAELPLPQYRKSLLAFLSHPHPYVFTLPPNYRSLHKLLNQLLSQRIWDFYNLEDFFSAPGNLFSFLGRLNLESAAIFLQKLDPYFQGPSRTSYELEVQNYLDTAIADFCNPDISEYSHLIQLDQLLNRVAFDRKDIEANSDEIIRLIEDDIVAEILFALRRISMILPSPFAQKTQRINALSIHVRNVPAFLELQYQEYTHSLYPPFPRDDSSELLSIDTLFQRESPVD